MEDLKDFSPKETPKIRRSAPDGAEILQIQQIKQIKKDLKDLEDLKDLKDFSPKETPRMKIWKISREATKKRIKPQKI